MDDVPVITQFDHLSMITSPSGQMTPIRSDTGFVSSPESPHKMQHFDKESPAQSSICWVVEWGANSVPSDSKTGAFFLYTLSLFRTQRNTEGEQCGACLESNVQSVSWLTSPAFYVNTKQSGALEM